MSSRKPAPKSAPKPAPKRSVVPFVIIGGVLVAAVVAALLLWSRQGQQTASTPTPRPNAASQGPTGVSPQQSALGAQPPHTRGGATATVTLEEFGDFQCPPCGRLHPELKRIEAEYGDRIKVIFRNMPLVRIHANALEAARAAEAAGQQGKFWEMHDLLFDNQMVWKDAAYARPVFAAYAERLGLNVDRFTRDMDSMVVNARIQADMTRADSLGVDSTPTLLLNGRELAPEEFPTMDALRGLIDKALGANTGGGGGSGKRG